MVQILHLSLSSNHLRRELLQVSWPVPNLFHEPYDAAQEKELLSKSVFLLCLGIPGILNCHISPHTAFKNLLEFQLLSSYPYYGCHPFPYALPKAKLLRSHLSWKGLMFSRIQLTFLPLIAFLQWTEINLWFWILHDFFSQYESDILPWLLLKQNSFIFIYEVPWSPLFIELLSSVKRTPPLPCYLGYNSTQYRKSKNPVAFFLLTPMCVWKRKG